MSFSHSDYDFFELLKSNIDGCPLCSLEEERVKRSMKVLLYESVTKRQFRKDIRFSRICRKHYEMFLKSVKEDLTVAGLGPAIIFWDMIKSQSEEMEKYSFLKKRQKNSDCYFCTYMETLPERIAQSAYNVLKTSEGAKFFTDSPSIICFDHFELLLKIATKKKDRAFCNHLKEIQKKKLAGLTDKLRHFIDKHDYANKTKITDEEAKSLKVAFRTVLKI